LAQEFAAAAERLRRELAIEWLGQELPPWREPCPISCQVGEELGAGGATTFVFDQGPAGPVVYGWRMTVQGSRERILDSVLPHEITHTVFATHFRRPLPRWADEGASTTVEHDSERSKQHAWLINFLKTGRGIPFDKMFAMQKYPQDIMPLYAQGYSTARYLINQGGRRKFVKFMETAFASGDWPAAVQAHYGHADLGALQNAWLAWVRDGSPMNVNAPPGNEPKANDIQLASHDAPADRGAGRLQPVRREGRGVEGAVASRGTPDLSTSVASRGVARSSDGWRARAPRGSSPSATSAAFGERPTGRGDVVPTATTGRQHEAVHPQGIEPARQIILEWERSAAAAVAPGVAMREVSHPGAGTVRR
jgi:hypothetical protein